MSGFLLICTAFALILTGCSIRQQTALPPQPVPPTNRGYVDLEPGWRVKVVTPILKSGEFLLSEQAIRTNKAGPDFVGYELAYYSVDRRTDGGVSIRVASVERFIGGQRAKARQPLARLFEFPRNERFVRLLFFTRVSEADHDEGILAAASMQELVQATRYVLADPEANCRTDEGIFCSWIPRGIAAQAEKRTADGKNWVWTW